jgi:hypothetical protein
MAMGNASVLAGFPKTGPRSFFENTYFLIEDAVFPLKFGEAAPDHYPPFKQPERLPWAV